MVLNHQLQLIWNLDIDPAYNCSAIAPPGDWWTVNRGTRRPSYAVYCIAVGLLGLILYSFCLFGLWKHRKFSCYKIMLYLAAVDMSSLVTLAILPGVFLLRGWVFCSHPTFLYIVGAFTISFWCTACMTGLLLVVNRISDFYEIGCISLLFKGRRTLGMLMIPTIYGLYFLIATPPDAFNSTFGAYLFTPLIGNPEYQHTNLPCTANNIFVVVATGFLYILFAALFIRKMLNATGSAVETMHKARFSILLQSCCICTLNTAASFLYLYMQFFPVPEYFSYIATVVIQFMHASPAAIYLTMNPAVRRAALAAFGLDVIRVRDNLASATNSRTAPLPKSATRSLTT